MQPDSLVRDTRIRVSALVCVCFLLGSAGWIAWLYRITDLAEPSMVDFYTMVLGYLSQVVGIGVYMLVRRKASGKAAAISTMVALGLYVALMEPATMSGSLVPTLAFGYAMNVLCGYFQGHYLVCLAELVVPNGRGITFGAGYALSTLATWILSSIGGELTSGTSNILVCVLVALLAMALVWVVASTPASTERFSSETKAKGLVNAYPTRTVLVLAGVAVIMASLVKNAGFSFPTADLSGDVNLELSRLLYGVGLVLAGIVADRDRRYVLACCAASLAVPFIMLALSGGGASGVTLWALGYLLFGFFAVWRVVLFADIADQCNRPWIAGFGLLFGRVGDILGTALFLALGNDSIMLVAVSSALFVVAAALLFALLEKLYGRDGQNEPTGEGEEFDPLEEFSKQYSLSSREQDVLFFVVDGLPNSKISLELSISEATVKFHMRNILKKTDCSNRVELTALYNGIAQSQ